MRCGRSEWLLSIREKQFAAFAFFRGLLPAVSLRLVTVTDAQSMGIRIALLQHSSCSDGPPLSQLPRRGNAQNRPVALLVDPADGVRRGQWRAGRCLPPSPLRPPPGNAFSSPCGIRARKDKAATGGSAGTRRTAAAAGASVLNFRSILGGGSTFPERSRCCCAALACHTGLFTRTPAPEWRRCWWPRGGAGSVAVVGGGGRLPLHHRKLPRARSRLLLWNAVVVLPLYLSVSSRRG